MYIVMQKIKFPGSNVVIIGSLPYFCICFLIAILFSKTIGLGFFLYIIQAALIIFLGGVSLGNYLTKNNKANSQLFVSTFLLSIAQLLVVASEYYFENNGAIAALTNVFFALGNYIFYLFVLGQEKKMKKYKIIN
jgi:hypothetical protein